MFSFKNIVLACLLVTGTTARAQQVYDGWEFSMGAGYATYFGDLSPYAIRNVGDAGKLFRFLEFNKNYIETPSFHFGLEKKLSPSSGILFSANYSNIAMSDRYVNGKDDLKTDSRNFDRALNFRSDIFDLGAAYRISVPLRYRIIPSFWAGAGASYFTSYGDLYDADGDPYDYAGGNVETDQRYETKLRPLETEERYSNIAPYVNAGIGLAFRVSEKVSIGWETDVRYSFSDYIDDVSGTYRTTYNSPEQMYAAMPGTNMVAPGMNRGNDDGIKDFYTQNRLVVKVGFSSFKKLAREKAARFKAPVIYPAYYPEFQKADSSSNKDSVSISSQSNNPVTYNNAIDSLRRRADSLQTALQQDSLRRRIKELENRIRQDSQRTGNPIYIQNTIIINRDSVSMPGNNGVNNNMGRRYTDSIVVNESYEVNWDSLRNTGRIIPGNNRQLSDSSRSYTVQERFFTETEQKDFEMPPPGMTRMENTPVSDTLNLQEMRLLEQEATQLRERNNAAAKDSLALIYEKEINQLRLRNDSIKLALLRQNIRTTDSLQQIRVNQGNTTPTPEQTRVRENYTAQFNELNRSINDLQRRNADLEASLRANQGNYAPQPANNDRYYRRLDNELNALNRQMSRNNRRFEPTIAPVVPIGGGNNRDSRRIEDELEAIREELEAIKNQRSLRDSLLTDTGSTNEIIVDTVFQENPVEQRRIDSMANMLNTLQQELSTLRNAQAAPVTTPVAPTPVNAPETRTISIYFDLGKTDISSDQFNKIRGLTGAIATANRIQVTARTDATGNKQVNERVSRQRANSVLNYLIRNFNIPPDKISLDYETAENGSGPNPLDRRVDIRIN